MKNVLLLLAVITLLYVVALIIGKEGRAEVREFFKRHAAIILFLFVVAVSAISVAATNFTVRIL